MWVDVPDPGNPGTLSPKAKHVNFMITGCAVAVAPYINFDTSFDRKIASFDPLQHQNHQPIAKKVTVDYVRDTTSHAKYVKRSVSCFYIRCIAL